MRNKRYIVAFVMLCISLHMLIGCRSSETTELDQSLIAAAKAMAIESPTETLAFTSEEPEKIVQTTNVENTTTETTNKPIINPKETSTTNTVDAKVASKMKVHFLDVGQGAATLFEIGDKTLIIDGGDRDKSSFVVAYLKKIGIRQIDVMVATHYDADHINGLVGVLNVFPVLQVYDANYVGTSRVYNSFKNFIKENSIPEAVPGMRQSIQVGEATVSFIAPKNYGHDEVNDDSISVRVQFGETSFVIMGDSSANAEQQILTQDLASDVFYATHHGSDGSNSKTLLGSVSPDYVVVSVGADNNYGHPGHNTMTRIRNIGAALYRTDKQGTIVCTSNGKTLTWDKDPCNDFTPGATNDAASTQQTTTAPIVSPTTKATTIPAATGTTEQAYVLNTNTKKFHYPACGSAATIKPENRQDVTSTRDAIISQGYAPCGNCDP